MKLKAELKTPSGSALARLGGDSAAGAANFAAFDFALAAAFFADLVLVGTWAVGSAPPSADAVGGVCFMEPTERVPRPDGCTDV
jgi:hypothetical protein